MIVYQATKTKFLDDVLSNDIENIVLDSMVLSASKRVGQSEINSWRDSLQRAGSLISDDDMPGDMGVFVEYHTEPHRLRVDLLLTGYDAENRENVILIELKGWKEARTTDSDGIVLTRYQGSLARANHPSYQAWSYATAIASFNEPVAIGAVLLHPCAYAHNYDEEGILDNPFYATYLNSAPLFMKSDGRALREFIKKHIRRGDAGKALFTIENGRIRPSKSLADSLASMLKGNTEFVMIGDQKLVLEEALSLVKHEYGTGKRVLLVEGGPGTGKSVVAVNLLVQITKQGFTAAYVTKNAAPRAVYEVKLTGSFKRTAIGNMFKGSGAFVDTNENVFDMLIVDEAHRLNEKSGLYQNKGDNQIKEILNSSKTTVFFLDEDQRVTLKDIGSKEEITRLAKEAGAQVFTATLSSQFRCNGSDSYLAWLDNALGIRSTSNKLLSRQEFDFQVFDTPSRLHDHIRALNSKKNRARLVAGYCWDWKSKKNPLVNDIEFSAFNYGARWNLDTDGSLWILAENSVEEVGCIHTCQGLELDHVGVIVGDDFVVRNGEVVTNGLARSSQDRSIRGFRKMLKQDPVGAKEAVDAIIKNTYRTLMTRGMRSSSVYFTDRETEDYFRAHLAKG